jgi:hypothetical protein
VLQTSEGVVLSRARFQSARLLFLSRFYSILCRHILRIAGRCCGQRGKPTDAHPQNPAARLSMVYITFRLTCAKELCLGVELFAALVVDLSAKSFIKKEVAHINVPAEAKIARRAFLLIGGGARMNFYPGELHELSDL